MTDVGRFIPFTTLRNFRDLGGYPAADGRRVRRGVVYRSDGLYHMEECDHALLGELGLRTVLDLRRPDELASRGRVTEQLGLAYRNVDFCEVTWPADTTITVEAIAQDFGEKYLDMAEVGITGLNPVGQSLSLVADPRNAPLVFHCAAGKDRTGILAALILALLGVGDEDIADDYALSAVASRRYQQNWRRTAAEQGIPLPAWVINPAPREAMEIVLAGLRERYGSIEAYAALAGFDRTKVGALRTHLLEPA